MTIYQKREEFFKSITAALCVPVTDIDRFLAQDKYYVSPTTGLGYYVRVSMGDMIIPVEGEFFGIPFKFWYSFWQVGHSFKIGLMIRDNTLGAKMLQSLVTDSFWSVPATVNNESNEGLLYDWTFFEPELLDSFLLQEKYALGMRHMHFQILKNIYRVIENKEVYKLF